MKNINNSSEPLDFSFVPGGPLFQLPVRSGLAASALGLVKRRIVFFALFVWLTMIPLEGLITKFLGLFFAAIEHSFSPVGTIILRYSRGKIEKLKEACYES